MVDVGLPLEVALLASDGPSEAAGGRIEPRPGIWGQLKGVGSLPDVWTDGTQSEDNDVSVVASFVLGFSGLERLALVDLELSYIFVRSRVSSWNLTYGDKARPFSACFKIEAFPPSRVWSPCFPAPV